MSLVKFQRLNFIFIILFLAQLISFSDSLFAQNDAGLVLSAEHNNNVSELDNTGAEYDNETIFESENDGECFIGIMLWKSIHIYQDNVNGLKKGLKESGLKFDWELLNAYKNEEKVYKIIDYFVESDKSLIISFGSWGAVIASEYRENIPVVVLGVNSPVAYGLANENKFPVYNLTGSSYYIDPIKQINYFKEIYPDLNTLGIVYSPCNAASHAEVPATRDACQELGIELLEAQIHKDVPDGQSEQDIEVQIKQAVSEIIDNVDAVLIPTNSELYKNVDCLLEITKPAKKPVFSYSFIGVKNGALAGLCSDNFKLGYKTAEIIVDILKNNKHVSQIPFVFDESPMRVINLKAAENIGFTVPEEVITNSIDVKQLKQK